MLKKGVSDLLYGIIGKLMSEALFDDFFLGGGTNLAIKYNHRLSVDIDLFSSNIVGTKKLDLICSYFKKEFGKDNVRINKLNFESEQLAFLQVNLVKEEVKVDIIQNLKLFHDIEILDGIRLINDIDIGALKLLAAADRGNQKDFYDLFLLSTKNNLKVYYDALVHRAKTLSSDKDRTIFDIQIDNPLNTLQTSLTPLGNFNKAGDKKNSGNRIMLVTDSALNKPWPVLREEWVKKVEVLALDKNLGFHRTKHKRPRKGFLLL